MTPQEKIEKIKNLVEAIEVNHLDVIERATKVLRKQYPEAPEAMIETGVYHVFSSGVHAALDWLVAASEVISDEKEFPDRDRTSNLYYYLYNWYLLSDLLPSASENLLEHMKELKDAFKSGDYDAAEGYIHCMKKILEGHHPPPDLW